MAIEYIDSINGFLTQEIKEACELEESKDMLINMFK